jgi:hypothetical protein
MSQRKQRDPKTFRAATRRIIDASYRQADEAFDRYVAKLEEVGGGFSREEKEDSLLREGFVRGFHEGAEMALDMMSPLFKDEAVHARRVASDKAAADPDGGPPP